ncbi:MAG: HAMP domain-containing protein [Calditrichaeota bacterium]|nr:Cache 3/Cache 2 fusion domain-containing protein [Calditrichota bacterium]RQW03704.1 MAG: HAMP domain-containing protein [Calditrichota bacterium]
MKKFNIKTYFEVFKRLIRGYLEKKIQRRMVLNFVGLGVLPILIVSFILIRLTENTVQSYIFERNMEIARGASNEISLFIREPVTILGTIAQTRDILEMERFTQSRVINKIQLNNSLFQKIYILDRSGIAVVTTSFGEELKDYSEDPALRAAMTGQTYFSPVYFTRSSFPAMSVALPIRKYNTVEAVLVGEIDLQNIWRVADSIQVGKTGFAFVLSSDGSVIAHPEKQKVLNKESLADYFFYQELMEGKSGTAFFSDNGNKMIASYVPIPVLNWGIVVQQTEKEAFELVRKMTNQVLIFVLLTTVLAILLATGTIRRITQPIETLVNGVRQYAEGHLTHRIKIERQDELVVLAEEFNKMAESLEKNQRQLRRMERLAAISRFASLVSHEIRNPLNAMNINMQILRRLVTQEETAPDKKIKYLNIISSEINRMNSLVSNFLAITRPPELNLIRSDIHQILEEVVITLEAQARSMGILVKRKYSANSCYGMFDYNQLKQVFQNILLNAFEAMPEGGEVSIETHLSTSDKKKKSQIRKVSIQVTDTGSGIPNQKLGEIFEFYYTTKKTGTGLGLAIAKQIVEGHKGDIRITSKEASGTTVFIELPLEG